MTTTPEIHGSRTGRFQANHPPLKQVLRFATDPAKPVKVRFLNEPYTEGELDVLRFYHSGWEQMRQREARQAKKAEAFAKVYGAGAESLKHLAAKYFPDPCPLTNPFHNVVDRDVKTPIYDAVAKAQGISPAETWAESAKRVQRDRLSAMLNARLVYATAMPLDTALFIGSGA